ncbi:MAG TPA: peptidoglycan DD-metalloendopeptidase family protein [Kiloniellales bacterium]|nr:peptidoglycan DD-metalloendopeptidase family protein [Kiloniellales bacterium]
MAPIALAVALLAEPSESPADALLIASPALPQAPIAALSTTPAALPRAPIAALPATAVVLPVTPPPAVPDLERALPVSLYVAAQPLSGQVLAAEAAPAANSVIIEVASGDTLMALLTREGVSRQDAHDAVAALEAVFSARDLRPGQELRLTFDEPEEVMAAAGEEPGQPSLLALALQPSVDADVQVVRSEDGSFSAAEQERPLRMELQGAAGVIDDSLFAAADSAGVPIPALIELIRIFSFDVDFQREIQPGDSFEVLYEAYYDGTGALAKTGKILFAGLTLSGKPLELYNFTPSSGFEDFFDLTGQSVRKALMKTPIDGARLSSNFGMRKHPILGYNKMHKGVDFAAPTGTPIYAAGDGIIEMAGWNSGYGKYVRIKHNSTYKTAYAHMSKIAKGIGKGTRVSQGEIIGYVGTTGQSTGPHLHYEVHMDGKPVNPLGIKLPAGEKLAGTDLANFLAAAAEIDKLRRTAVTPQVAEKVE